MLFYEIGKCGSVSENKVIKNQKFFFFKRSIKLRLIKNSISISQRKRKTDMLTEIGKALYCYT